MGDPAARARASSLPASASAAATPGSGTAPVTYSIWQSISTRAESESAFGVKSAPAICSRVFGSLMVFPPRILESANGTLWRGEMR
jgi:hypothetical protein